MSEPKKNNNVGKAGKGTGDTSDILDQVKKVEKMVKMNLLMKSIAKLKEIIKGINEDKAECIMILEEIGINKEDIKRIIDFVGDTSDVKLKDEDKKEIRDRVKDDLSGKKQEIEKKIDDKVSISSSTSSSISPSDSLYYRGMKTGDTEYFVSTCDASSNYLNLTSDSGQKLELKV